MVIFNYTHTFTLQQLDIILIQYLELGPFFECLKKVFKTYIARFQSIPLVQRHNPDKQHPIKLPVNFYKYKTKISGQIDKDTWKGEIEYVYPLTTIIEVLNSNEFYKNLPKNTIINGLLTTTNINIIIETLSIISEELSKLVRSTLDSIEEKHLSNYINTLVNDCLGQEEHSESGFTTPARQSIRNIPFNDLKLLGLLFQKEFNTINEKQGKDKSSISESEIESDHVESVVKITGIESEDKNLSFSQFKSKSNSISNRNSSKNTSILISTLLNSPELKKGSNQNILKKLTSLIKDQKALEILHNFDKSQGQEDKAFILDDEFAKKPKEFIQCEYCTNMRNYLLESTGFSYFDVQSISKIPTDTFKVLKKIKSIINVFTLYLGEANRTTIPASLNTVNKVLSNIEIVITQNLWENKNTNSKIADKNIANKKSAIQNSQRSAQKNPTLIDELEPYFKNVYTYKDHDSNELSIDELLRVCLKAPELKQIEKKLVEKYMNEARVRKQGKDIETFIITKQKISNKMNIQLQGNQNDSRNSQVKSNYLQRPPEPFVNQIQLLKEYEKQQAIINRAVINSKPIYSQINKKYQNEENIGSEFKRHKVYNPTKNSKYAQKSKTLIFNKNNNDTIENEKFKMIIYQQYMRNQGFNVTKNNMSSIINQNVMKITKSMNFIGKEGENYPDFSAKDHIENNYSQFYPSHNIQTHTSNTLSTFHLKTQENDISYDKKETQIYNKMLLNGQTIRNEVLSEVEYGQTVIYQSLDDFFKKLDELALEDEKNQIDEENDDVDENLFLTMSGPNLKKTSSNKKSTPKNQSSIRNSKRFDMEGLSKSQSAKLYKNQSIVSFETSKEFKSTNFKKQIFDEGDKTLKQPRVKKQFKSKHQTCGQSQNNDSFNREWNINFELKKPAWLEQYEDKAPQKSLKRPQTAKNPQTLLENSRFMAFQEKNLIQKHLNAQEKQRKSSQTTTKINFTINNLKEIDQNISKSSANIQRPLSGVNPASKNRMGTIKSLNRGLNGKKRSLLLTKEFSVQNNSLLTKIYKETIGKNTIESAKGQVEQQKIFEEFKLNIEKSKFRADKLIA